MMMMGVMDDDYHKNILATYHYFHYFHYYYSSPHFFLFLIFDAEPRRKGAEEEGLMKTLDVEAEQQKGNHFDIVIH